MPQDFSRLEPSNTGEDRPENKGFVYPTTGASTETVELASIQTALARNLYYHPGDDAKNELALVSGKLLDGLNKLDQDTKMALGDRLFGPEGLMGFDAEKRRDSAACIGELTDVLKRVQNKDNASPHDRVVTVAMLGDIGAMFTENTATTGLTGGRTPEQILRIKKAFAFNQDFADEVKTIAGSNVLGPSKKTDRTRSENTVARTGIFGTGEAVDATLLDAGEATIKPSSWSVGMVKQESVSRTTEPWAGHISGSPPEILLAWESLLYEDQKLQPYVHALKNVAENEEVSAVEGPKPNMSEKRDSALTREQWQERNGRSALAHGFFPATGYHSAMEVMESALLYSGQATRELAEDNAGKKVAAPALAIDGHSPDASYIFSKGAATSLIGELCYKQTHDSHRDRLQTLPAIRSTDALQQAMGRNNRLGGRK